MSPGASGSRDESELPAIAELPADASPEIRASWERSWRSGVRPDTPIEHIAVSEIDPSSRLLDAALPVLDQVADDLEGTSFFTILTDHAARITHRGRITPRIRDVLDTTGVVLGRPFAENTTGTNALAAAYELRRGVVVRGEEHYAQRLRCYSAYGHPIVHPITRRLEGVLALGGRAGEENPLFAPFLRRAAQEIERNLLAGARESERRLLDAFDAATGRGERAVLALGDGGDVVLANRFATEHMDAEDHARLRELLDGLRGDGPWTLDVTTARGLRLEVVAEPIDRRRGSLLLSFTPVFRSRVRAVGRGLLEPAESAADRELARCRAHRLSTFVVGEPGTGRSTTARALADGTDAAAVVLDCTDVDGQGRVAWVERLRQVTSAGDLAVLDGVELLDDHLLRVVGDRVAAGAWIAATSPPLRRLGPDHRNLAFRCLGRIELVPLRERRSEIPGLAKSMLAAATGGAARFAPAALARLAELDWPGNLTELNHVVQTVAARRSAGDVLVTDLPAEYRTGPVLARLSPWERSEYEAIQAALVRNGGNKVQAAKDLGISRGTLYNRIRTLRIEA
ncbi:Transcriptional regulator of acetoin/glycerol metabolism [Pseudonocardia thermophila]|uniref:Transcriptional regulator of acetoin/glycerol metabolism n=1 Tax=Pseudonocardia thermophila TaxID=1848 RepID=A0A1M6S9U6_PSETH|nr:helix-turn-helix domain-containing protein [Pseudonocardia thermophila]SHK41534.1 Transcriptional regulator of acetoin/glycerol metabolism [Pseudonocardia thermophila]